MRLTYGLVAVALGMAFCAVGQDSASHHRSLTGHVKGAHYHSKGTTVAPHPISAKAAGSHLQRRDNSDTTLTATATAAKDASSTVVTDIAAASTSSVASSSAASGHPQSKHHVHEKLRGKAHANGTKHEFHGDHTGHHGHGKGPHHHHNSSDSSTVSFETLTSPTASTSTQPNKVKRDTGPLCSPYAWNNDQVLPCTGCTDTNMCCLMPGSVGTPQLPFGPCPNNPICRVVGGGAKLPCPHCNDISQCCLVSGTPLRPFPPCAPKVKRDRGSDDDEVKSEEADDGADGADDAFDEVF